MCVYIYIYYIYMYVLSLYIYINTHTFPLENTRNSTLLYPNGGAETSFSISECADSSPFSFWTACVLGTSQAKEEIGPFTWNCGPAATHHRLFPAESINRGRHTIASAHSI